MSDLNINATEKLIYNLLWDVAAAKGTDPQEYESLIGTVGQAKAHTNTPGDEPFQTYRTGYFVIIKQHP